MKTRALFSLFVLVTLSCGKSDPSPTTLTCSCTVLFKGVTHTLTVVGCTEPVSGIDGVSASDANGTKSLLIARDTADPDACSITFCLGAGGSDCSYVSAAITSAPNLSRTGKNWTFSGDASDGIGAASPLSGTCTCGN